MIHGLSASADSTQRQTQAIGTKTCGARWMTMQPALRSIAGTMGFNTSTDYTIIFKENIMLVADWIEALLMRGWEIKWRENLNGWQWRSPDQFSGSEYIIEGHELLTAVLPPIVKEWCIENMEVAPKT